MKCLICNKRLKQGKKFCSYECYGLYQRKRIKKHCLICKKIFEFPASQTKQNRRTCSRKCHFIYLSVSEHIKGEKHHCWKGGRHITQEGYILIKNYNHHYRNKNNCIFENRFMVEKQIGRYLNPEEVVHHINQIPNDNRIENLQLLTKPEHTKLHNYLTKGEKC